MDRASAAAEIAAIEAEEAESERIRTLLDGHGERMSRRNALQRKVERMDEYDAALAVDPEYPDKVERAKAAEAETRAAYEALQRQAYLRVRNEFGSADLSFGDGRLGAMNPAFGAIVPPVQTDPPRAMAEMRWKMAVNYLRRLEKWPANVAAALREPPPPAPEKKKSRFRV